MSISSSFLFRKVAVYLNEMQSNETVAKVIFIFISLGSLMTIAIGKDSAFPFSNYPMYSELFPLNSTLDVHSVIAESDDGSSKQLTARAEIGPFWSASLREALLVEPDEEKIRDKLQQTFLWINSRREQRGLLPYKKLRLYRHELPWAEFSERRLRGQELRSLYYRNRILRIEVGKSQ
jgi:hypothetical protein